MRVRLLAVLQELTLTQAELLEYTDILARERVLMHARDIRYKEEKEKYLLEHEKDKGITRMTLYNIIYNDTSVSERSASLILETLNSVARKRGVQTVYSCDDIGICPENYYGKEVRYVMAKHVCGQCGYNFHSLDVFDKHRTGEFDGTGKKPGYSSRRCLSPEEMKDRGWLLSEQSVKVWIDGKPGTTMLNTWSIPIDERGKERLRHLRERKS